MQRLTPSNRYTADACDGSDIRGHRGTGHQMKCTRAAVAVILISLGSFSGCLQESGGSASEGAFGACSNLCSNAGDCVGADAVSRSSCLNSCDAEYGSGSELDESDTACSNAVKSFMNCAAGANCVDLALLYPFASSEDLVLIHGCEDKGAEVTLQCE